MITNISLVTVYCLDQDAARDFYVDVLGFQAKTDVTMGDDYRWVTVAHPNQPELEVTLMLPGPPRRVRCLLPPRAPAAREGPDGRSRAARRGLPQGV